MTAKDLPLCDWSVLSPVVPTGFETGDVEAMSSYVCGLSLAHSLKPSDVMANLVLPRTTLNQDWTTSRRMFAHIVNGLGAYAEGVVGAIESLTQQTHLSTLTAIPWRGFLNPRGNFLLKGVRQWCHHCYLEREEAGLRVSDSLYWYFSPVKICAEHRTPLRSTCPKCSAQQPFFPRLPFLDLCDACGNQLSAAYGENIAHADTTGAANWTARCMRDLVARSFEESEPRACEWQGKLVRLSQTHFEGKMYLMEDALGVRRGQLRHWIHVGSKPSLELIADLCFRLDIPIGRFVFDSDELSDPTFWRRPDATDFRHVVARLSGEEARTIRQYLIGLAANQERSPIDLKAVAKLFGVSVSLLKSRFPELCTGVTDQTRMRNVALVKQRAEERRARLLRAAQQLLLSGRRPSHRQLRATGEIKGGDLQYLAQIGGIEALFNMR